LIPKSKDGLFMMNIDTECTKCGDTHKNWQIQGSTILNVGDEIYFTCNNKRCSNGKHKITRRSPSDEGDNRVKVMFD
jgi:hypothetical protein